MDCLFKTRKPGTQWYLIIPGMLSVLCIKLSSLLSVLCAGCVTDLDQRSKIIILESLLTTFKCVAFIEAAGAVAKNRLNPKTLSPKAN